MLNDTMAASILHPLISVCLTWVTLVQVRDMRRGERWRNRAGNSDLVRPVRLELAGL